MSTKVTVTGLEDLLATIPHLLGYEPGDGSMVGLVVSGSKVMCSFRVALADVVVASEMLTAQLAGVGGSGVILVAYCAPDDEVACWARLLPVAAEIDTNAVPVLQAVVACGDTWLSTAGDSGPRPSATNPAAMACAVAAGSHPLASRADVVAALSARPASAAVATALQDVAAPATPADLVPIWLEIATAPVDDITPQSVAAAIVSAQQGWVRDGLIAALAPFPGMDDTDPPARAFRDGLTAALPTVSTLAMRDQLWQLVGLIPDIPAAAHALGLATYLAWWCGDGTVANVLLDRTRQLDPTCPLADIVDGLITLAVRPPSTVA